MSSCLVCDSSKTRFFGYAPLRCANAAEKVIKFFAIAECETCGSLMLEGCDQIGLRHSRAEPWTAPAHTQKFFERRKPVFDKLLNILNSFDMPNKNVIDFGCSFGHFTFILDAAGWHSIGVEPLKETRECAVRNYPHIKFYDSVEAIESAREGYGCVVAIDSLYYVDDAKKTVSALKEKMSPGGVIMIRVLNRATICRLEKLIFGLLRFKHFGSTRINFSKKGLQILLEKAGFHKIRWNFLEKYKRKVNPLEYLYTNLTGIISALTFGRILLSPAFIVTAKLKEK